MYTIPSIALFGFLIPFSGIGDTTAILALTVYAYSRWSATPIPVSPASTGRSSKPPAGWEVPRFRFFIKSRSACLSGDPLRSSEYGGDDYRTCRHCCFIGAGGLGVAIYRGITTNNGVLTVAGSLLIAVLALLTDWGIGCYETHIKKKRKLI